MTAQALAIYGLGLPAFVLQKVLQPLYFAREDTKSPFYFALVAMVVNAVLAIGLAGIFGFLAAAIGTTLAGWVMVLQLWRGSRTMGDAAQIDARLRRVLPRILLATAIMAGALYGVEILLSDALQTAGLRYGALAILVLTGMAVYAIAALAFGAVSKQGLKSMLRRG